MRNDLPAIILSREAHVEEILDFWRQKQIDRISDDIIFEEDERKVTAALIEPEWPSEKHPVRVLGRLALNSLFWVPVIVLAFEWLRP
jgi:hypothetical protein